MDQVEDSLSTPYTCLGYVRIYKISTYIEDKIRNLILFIAEKIKLISITLKGISQKLHRGKGGWGVGVEEGDQSPLSAPFIRLT